MGILWGVLNLIVFLVLRTTFSFLMAIVTGFELFARGLAFLLNVKVCI